MLVLLIAGNLSVMRYQVSLNCHLFKNYRDADKSLARPWKETSYSDQYLNTIQRLMAYKQQDYIAVVCTP